MIETVLAGLGGMGKVHFKNTQLIPNAKIAAAVGITDADRAVAREAGLPFFETITEAVRAIPSITVADIATPSFLHKRHALEALSCGLDVIVEKPVALSSSDAEEIFAAAAKAGRRVLPAHVMRFTKEFRALKAIVDGAPFGRALAASFSRITQVPQWSAGGWLADAAKSGHVPFDLHIHDLDMIFALFGKPQSVSCAKASSGGLDAYYRIVYGYGGFSVTAEVAWLRARIPFTAEWRVIFERGAVFCSGNAVMVYPEDAEPFAADTTYDTLVSTGINVPATGWYFEELVALYECLKSPSAPPPIPPEDVIEELRIIEAAELSSKS